MDEILGFSLTSFKPISRPIADTFDDYPWGDGYPDDCTLIGPDGPDDPNEPTPGGPPAKWPRLRDWRSPGFLPWSLRNSVPMPAAWTARVELRDDQFLWPDPSDDGKLVLVYPLSNPSLSTTRLSWGVSGLSGGRVQIETGYVSFASGTERFPSGSLEIRSTAIIGTPDVDEMLFQSDWRRFRPSTDYQGPFEWFGPMVCDDMRKSGNMSQTSCVFCIKDSSIITLPDLGIGSPLPGGDHVSGINRAWIAGQGLLNLCNFESAQSIPIDEEVGGACEGEIVSVGWAAEAVYIPPVPNAGIIVNLQYNVSRFIQDPTDGCRGQEVACCAVLADIYDDPLVFQNGGSGHSAGYFREGVIIDCNDWIELVTGGPLQKINELGNPWAGTFPDEIELGYLSFD